MKQNEEIFKLDTIEEAIIDIKKGKVIIVVDDEDRENEGDFVAAAETVTPEMINFMATHGRGLICNSITKETAERLHLPMMVDNNTVLHQTAFTVSVDLNGNGCTTGISATDRAKTIQALIDLRTKPSDLGRPGHIFPLVVKEGGVLRRTGHTEASHDLAVMSGFAPAGVLVEILNEDGTMARLPQLVEVAKKFNLKLISIEDLVAYRLKNESLVKLEQDFQLSTKYGELRLRSYSQTNADDVHIVVSKGTWNKHDIVPVRVEVNQVYSDITSLLNGDNHDHLEEVFKMISQSKFGVLVLVNQHNKTQNILRNLSALESKCLENTALTKIKSEHKDIGIGSQILADIGIGKINLITNSPNIEYVGLEGYGLEITSTCPYQK
ncbi:MAG: 3,4-dihydroxy 2-butanone 4-phosphate synthase/GTP cyclohydrolase II [Crocinitomicaceae bacterium]|jgi:3,4-dihydroxy 2-butanone 4-phosphate synthase/GTP cyclohydrolase II